MTTAPDWALKVLRAECRRAKVTEPTLTWRHRSDGCTSGRYYPWERRIVCSVPAPLGPRLAARLAAKTSPEHVAAIQAERQQDALRVLLHEIAHHLAGRAPRGRRTHKWHGKHFQATVRRLYRRHGLLEPGHLKGPEYATVRRALERQRPGPDLTVEQMLDNVAAWLVQVGAIPAPSGSAT